MPVIPSSALGVPIDAREALGMAILGTFCADGEPIIGGASFVSGTWSGLSALACDTIGRP